MTIKELLTVATDKQASDLHLVVGLPPVIRIDGDLHMLEDYTPLAKKDMETMVASIVSETDMDRFRTSRELDIGFEIDNFRYRINLHFEKTNIGLVARVITERSRTWTRSRCRR